MPLLRLSEKLKAHNVDHIHILDQVIEKLHLHNDHFLDVIKHRNGRSRFPFKIGFDYSMGTLDMFEISKERYKEALAQVQQRRSEEIEFDSYSDDRKKKTKPNSSVVDADEE